MRRRLLVTMIGGALGLALMGAAPAGAAPGRAGASAASARLTVLQTTLNFQETVPPGDPDGSGEAIIVVKPGGTVCFRILARGIGPILAIHIHEAPAGKQGPHAVDLFGPLVQLGDGSQAFVGCVFGEAKAAEVASNPTNFYVNVHTREFVLGAIRGQLGD